MKRRAGICTRRRGQGVHLFPRRRPLSGKNVLITAGPTREHLDPIRFITNGSTGRMGYALATALRDLGARVVMVNGPIPRLNRSRVKIIEVVTAAQMRREVRARIGRTDVFISAAAVGDWRFARTSSKKIKKNGGPIQVELIPNPDIVADAARRARRSKRRPLIVGFALETDHWLSNARRKLIKKHLDLIVANRAESMGNDRTHLAILDRLGAVQKLPPMSKVRAARAIARRIEEKILCLKSI